MKRLDKKGFTLIELLAVIVIMGILMMVAIPAVQRYINNSRKETYVNTIKEYVNAVDTAYAAGELSCSGETGKYFYVSFTDAKKLLKSGGNSPYNNSAIYGYIGMYADTSGKVTYRVAAGDGKKIGVYSTDINSLTASYISGVSFNSSTQVSTLLGSYYYNVCTVN